MSRLKNKVAIITGGAGSIGAATAKKFLEQGAKVVLVDLSKESLEKTFSDLKSADVSFVVADVTKSADVKNYVEAAVKLHGKIDIFFNNAGIEGVVKPITEYPEEVFDKVIAVNVKGVWLGCKYVLPEMKEGGSIIITSSVAGVVGSPGTSAYNTSKHAVIGTMRSVALEAAPKQIRVNTVNPSAVDNRMMRSLEDGIGSGNAEAAKKAIEGTIPFGRYAKPEEIADMVVFLASDESKFVSGTVNLVDGASQA